MCMIGDAEDRVTMIQDGKYQVARLKHKCKECGRAIEIGERYHAEVFIYDRMLSRHKTCTHCMVVREWLAEECGGWLYGGVEEDAREHVLSNPGFYRRDLYRACVGMQLKWRSPSGRLLPIPRRITTTDEILAARTLKETEPK